MLLELSSILNLKKRKMRKIYEKSLILNISLLNKIKLERFIIDRRM